MGFRRGNLGIFGERRRVHSWLLVQHIGQLLFNCDVMFAGWYNACCQWRFAREEDPVMRSKKHAMISISTV